MDMPAFPQDPGELPEDPFDPMYDPTEGMTPEERMGYEMVRTLEGQLVTSDDFQAAKRATASREAALQREIDTMRFITRFNRRTHFMVMGYVVFGMSGVNTLAREYDGVWWSLLYPLISHQGGPEELEAVLRVLGVIWQATAMSWLIRHSQVPPWLLDRVATLALTEEDYLRKWPLERGEDPPAR